MCKPDEASKTMLVANINERRETKTTMVTSVGQTLREVLLLVQLSCVVLVGHILLRVSSAKKILIMAMRRAASISLPEEVYWDSLFTWQMITTLWQQGKLDIRKTASRGKSTPNPLLVDPSTGKETELVKILSLEKLHVLAFGSYSCPVFRMKFNELKSIAREFHNLADFSIIYIDEAHPADGWAFKDDSPILKHRSIEDRLVAARKLRSFDLEQSIPVYADSMRNEASKMFGVNAIRLYVIQNETVVYEGGVGPTYYSLDEVKQVIQSCCTFV